MNKQTKIKVLRRRLDMLEKELRSLKESLEKV